MRRKIIKAGKEVVGLQGIELYREGRLVLKNVNLTICHGQHWVMLGPNGSGKSSMLSVLQGLLWPIEGSITVLGRRFGESDLTEMRKLIGFVGNEIEPQFPAWQTVLEIAESGGSGTIGIQFDQPKLADKKRARKLLGQAGMLPLLHRPLAFLSQGQRRLATIVRALMVKPGILILDEPAAGLDPVAREDFLDKLGTLMAEEKNNLGGPIILYVTHHVEEIIPAFTHALLLREGRVLSQGPISECLTATNLSKVFGRKVRITKQNGRLSLRLVHQKRAG